MSDLTGDGDSKLVVADLGSGNYNMKLRVYKGTQLVKVLNIIYFYFYNSQYTIISKVRILLIFSYYKDRLVQAKVTIIIFHTENLQEKLVYVSIQLLIRILFSLIPKSA